MNDFMLFGMCAALGLLAWGALSYNYIWPRIKDPPISEAVGPLLYLSHFRFPRASFFHDRHTAYRARFKLVP